MLNAEYYVQREISPTNCTFQHSSFLISHNNEEWHAHGSWQTPDLLLGNIGLENEYSQAGKHTIWLKQRY